MASPHVDAGFPQSRLVAAASGNGLRLLLREIRDLDGETQLPSLLLIVANGGVESRLGGRYLEQNGRRRHLEPVFPQSEDGHVEVASDPAGFSKLIDGKPLGETELIRFRAFEQYPCELHSGFAPSSEWSPMTVEISFRFGLLTLSTREK